MSSETREYTVTVMEQDLGDASDPRVSAVIRLDNKSVPHIVQLTVRASRQERELAPYAVRDIDFARLADALLNTVAASERVTSTSASDDSEKDKNAQLPPRRKRQRPYRKMPAVNDVKTAFLDTNSVGKLAERFGVPRYTAQAWVDRLRRAGEL